MGDYERLELLKERLHELEQRLPDADERSFLDAAQQALLEEIGSLGQRLARRYYGRVPRRRRAS